MPSPTSSAAAQTTDAVPTSVKFATAGVGGIMGWIVMHPFNTAAVRMNLAASQPGYVPTGFLAFAAQTARERGVLSFYDGLGAGCTQTAAWTPTDCWCQAPTAGSYVETFGFGP